MRLEDRVRARFDAAEAAVTESAALLFPALPVSLALVVRSAAVKAHDVERAVPARQAASARAALRVARAVGGQAHHGEPLTYAALAERADVVIRAFVVFATSTGDHAQTRAAGTRRAVVVAATLARRDSPV